MPVLSTEVLNLACYTNFYSNYNIPKQNMSKQDIPTMESNPIPDTAPDKGPNKTAANSSHSASSASSATAELALSISGLHKQYVNFPVLKDLNLEVGSQSILGLVGLNGSGKTTTIECILGMQGFNSGSISVLGHHPSKLHELSGKVVGIFDTPSLHPNLSVRQSLQHARLLCAEPVRSCQEVEQMLGISRFSKFKIRHLSLGNRRKASIAQALLGNPELIILDEPFNGLDAEGVDDVLALIKTLNQEQGTAFLLSSHQLPYLEKVCTHIAILHEGKIAISDKVESLFSLEKQEVLVECDQHELASSVIDANRHTHLIKVDDNKFLHIELSQFTTAQLNRLLVENNIAVSHLSLQRASLDSLFRHISSEHH